MNSPTQKIQRAAEQRLLGWMLFIAAATAFILFDSPCGTAWTAYAAFTSFEFSVLFVGYQIGFNKCLWDLCEELMEHP